MNRLLLTYLILTYLISWTIWFPLYGHIFGLANLSTLPYHHAFGGLGPLIASVVTTSIFFKKEGLKNLLVKCIQAKPLIYLAVAFFSPFMLAFSALIITYFMHNTPINILGMLSAKEFPEFSFSILLLYNLIFFGFGEEVGWRGFALPQLQNKLNALSASVLLTLFWALWHLPLFFYRPGYTSMDFAGLAGWVFSLLTGSILLTWLYNSSRGSILLCAIFHSTIDIAFTSDIADKNVVASMGMLITIWGVLTILIFKPKNLSTNNKENWNYVSVNIK